MSTRSGPSWLSILQFTVSTLAMGLCWLASAGLAASLLIDQNNPGDVPGLSSLLSAQAIGMAVVGFLFLPGVWISFMDILGKKKAPAVPTWGRYLIFGSLLIWPLTIWLGYQYSGGPGFDTVALPFLTVLAIGIPILVWIEIGGWRLNKGSQQRIWGQFNTGILSGPLLAMPVELGLLFLAILGGVVWFSANPQAALDLQDLGQRLLFMSNDPDAIIRTLRPYLLHPGSIFAVLAAISGFVPLIEEAVKPVGLWFLAGRGLTPQEGFVGGLLSGAGFAFFESLGIAGSYSSENWTTLVLARAGTSLLHITTTALVGYGLAGAWQQRRFVRLGAVFLSAVALHGLWNALSIGSSITQLFGDALTGNAGGNTWLSFGATAAPWGLGFLVVLLLGILIGMNAWLRKPNLAGQPQPE